MRWALVGLFSVPRARRVLPAVAFLVGLGFAVCSGCKTTATAGGWHQVRLGLCEDYPEESRTVAAARRDLAFVQQSGAKVLRIAFGWDAMEPSQGKFDWSFWDDVVAAAHDEYQIELIPYLCYTPRWAATDAGENFWRSPPRDNTAFAEFVEAAVHRYRDRIHSWELWNEPDNASYWLGTREQFASLVKAGAAAVRRADPSAKIVLGGIATNLDFLRALFRDDHLAPFVDIVNFHSYLETWHGDAIEQLTPTIRQVAQIVRNFGENEPLWLAEAGYSSVGARPQTSDFYRPHYRDEHTEAAQARALIRTVVLAECSGSLSTVAWYRIHDLPPGETVIGDDNNRHLGLIGSDGKEKPAARAFAQLASFFSTLPRIARGASWRTFAVTRRGPPD